MFNEKEPKERGMNLREKLSLVSGTTYASATEDNFSSEAYQFLRKNLYQIIFDRIDLEKLQQMSPDQFKR